jgi:hypothetical protein
MAAEVAGDDAEEGDAPAAASAAAAAGAKLRHFACTEALCGAAYSSPSKLRLHADAVHFHAEPALFMCGVWIALEDIRPDAGPLAYVPEASIARYARARRFPIIPCTLCGSQANLQREVVGRMLADWERAEPGRLETIFAAIRDVSPSQLADTQLFDFAGLEAKRVSSTGDLP